MSQPNDRELVTSPARGVVAVRRGDNLADILERVLDKGIVIAGDITISLATVELLSIKIRLLIASVDKAREMGINWWQHDPALTATGEPRPRELEDPLTNRRLDRLERKLDALIEERPRRKRRPQLPRSRVRPRVRRPVGLPAASQSSPDDPRKGR